MMRTVYFILYALAMSCCAVSCCAVSVDAVELDTGSDVDLAPCFAVCRGQELFPHYVGGVYAWSWCLPSYDRCDAAPIDETDSPPSPVRE